MRAFARTTRSSRAALFAVLVSSTMLSACGGRSPFGDESRGTATSPTVAVPSDATSPVTAVEAPKETTSPQAPLPSSPGEAPAPAGTTATLANRDGPPPRTRAQRIAADNIAMLNVRTMVSVIEGCHSGRPSYRDCNTHAELGAPTLLGVEIGRKGGQVQISATTNGYRMTARSLSGAKFTVARGPKGDRFKCIPGKQPGACPRSKTWSW